MATLLRYNPWIDPLRSSFTHGRLVFSNFLHLGLIWDLANLAVLVPWYQKSAARDAVYFFAPWRAYR